MLDVKVTYLLPVDLTISVQWRKRILIREDLTLLLFIRFVCQKKEGVGIYFFFIRSMNSSIPIAGRLLI